MSVNIMNNFDTEKLIAITPNIANLLLVIFIAFSLSGLTWALLDKPQQQTAAGNRIKPLVDNSNKPNSQSNSNLISDASLFGKAEVVSATPDDSVITEDVKESILNIKLTGILAIGRTHGMAVISNNNKEKVYVVGDEIVSDATLKQVLRDKVILQTSRGLEALTLPIKSIDGLDFEQSTPPRTASVTSKSTGQKLLDYRKQFMRDFSSVAKFADVRPVKDGRGNFQGYKLNPKGDEGIFQELGLESNDVIVGVNGVSLNKKENGIKALRKLMHANELNLTILRNGQEIKIQHKVNE